MTETILGKIKAIEFGIRDDRLGLHFTLEGTCGVQDSVSVWDYTKVKCTEQCKWTEQSRNEKVVDMIKLISKLLDDAKVSNLSELRGKPVEMTFHSSLLANWRILTEVL